MDSRTEVNDVKFAPKHLGLQLVRETLNLCCSYVYDEHVYPGNLLHRWTTENL